MSWPIPTAPAGHVCQILRSLTMIDYNNELSLLDIDFLGNVDQSSKYHQEGIVIVL